MRDLTAQFGTIDVYWFDLFLRGQIQRADRILDAGCGRGRNLVYPLQAGYDVWACDANADAVLAVRDLAKRIAPDWPENRVQQADLRALPYEDAAFDVVLANAVLHMAPDHAACERMVQELGRVLAPGGLLLARLASGLCLNARALEDGRHAMPDGTTRYIAGFGRVSAWTEELGATWVYPLKTTIVGDQRAMSTWCIRKPRA